MYQIGCRTDAAGQQSRQVLRDAVIHAGKRPEVRSAVARVYDELQQNLDQRRPRCDVSGRCCRFEEFGHRLYVTTMELAAFVHDLQVRPPAWDGTGCPFQSRGLCGVHAIRPFGCRVFFCDPASDDWQHAQYERLHAELKRLHDELGVPYRYVEWRAALGEVGLLPARAAAQDRQGGQGGLSLPQLPL